MKAATAASPSMEASKSGIGALGVLAVFPIVFFLAANYVEALLGDFASDPNYSYLFNALNMVQLRAPTQYDHPGTSIQIVIALVSLVVHGARAIFQNVSFVDDILLHPELYLRCTSVALILATALALFALGSRVHRATASLPTALVAQGSIFLTAPVWTSGVAYVMPEGMLVPLAVALAALVAPSALSRCRPPHGALLASSVGIVLGACAATKTTSFPLALTILLIHGRKYQLLACVAAVGAAIVITLPIVDRYGFIIEYNLRILTHTGHWGSGQAGLPTFGEYWESLRGLYNTVPEMFISAGLCAILAGFSCWQMIRRGEPGLLRLFLVSVAGILLQLAIVAKHPGSPYLVPAVAFLSLANGGISFALLRDTGWRRVAGAIAVTAMLAYAVLHGGRDWIRYNIAFAAQRGDNRALEASYANSECRVLYTYESQSIGYKTWWGDQFAGGYRTARILKLYPDLIIYHNTWRHLEMNAGTIKTDQIDNWVREQKCVYLISSARDRFPPEFLGFSSSSLVVVGETRYGAGSMAVSRIVPAEKGASIFVPKE
jgi:hypothetical protein